MIRYLLFQMEQSYQLHLGLVKLSILCQVQKLHSINLVNDLFHENH